MFVSRHSYTPHCWNTHRHLSVNAGVTDVHQRISAGSRLRWSQRPGESSSSEKPTQLPLHSSTFIEDSTSGLNGGSVSIGRLEWRHRWRTKGGTSARWQQARHQAGLSLLLPSVLGRPWCKPLLSYTIRQAVWCLVLVLRRWQCVDCMLFIARQSHALMCDVAGEGCIGCGNGR